MKTITKQQIRLMRTLQHKLGMEDDEYRDYLRSRCNVESTKSLTSAQAYRLGQEMLRTQQRANGMTPSQYGRINGLESEMRAFAGWEGFGLKAWLTSHSYGPKSQLSRKSAARAIQALEQMKKRIIAQKRINKGASK